MRISVVATVAVALVAVVAVGVIGAQLIQGNKPLLADVSLSLSRITPNADGVEDLTAIQYTLNRTARVTIAFANKATRQRFLFRAEAMRIPKNYNVLFSGVVDGYTLPGENFESHIERRLMPDGNYIWTITAQTETGEKVEQQGDLTLANGDSVLPDIRNFDISPPVFTPNQDGYDDRVSINLFLAKQAQLTVYLEGKSAGTGSGPYYIAERFEGRKPGEPGAHVFDYDGGVDNNTPPPPNGVYAVVALAQDAIGQRVRRIGEVTLKDGGLPNAEIVAQSAGRTVTWAKLPWIDTYFTNAATPGQKIEPLTGITSTQVEVSMPQGDLLLFRLTVSNYGTTPIRTTGPWPGTVYTYGQTVAAMFGDDSREQPTGAWYVGVECERSESSYPWRWAIGPQVELTKVERDGEMLWYLMPGQQTTVWGAIRMTNLIRTRNPQKCYAALIHQDVAIPPRQNRIGEIDVRLTVPGQ